MKRITMLCAVGVGLLAAALLPVVFHAQPESPRPSAPAATPLAVAASPAPQRHPRIMEAIRLLEGAKRELESAPDEFHGHRVRAIDHVNRALEECHRALESAR